MAVASAVEGIDDDRLEDLRVAVSEACTAAVEMRQGRAAEDRIVVRCTVDDDRLLVCIEDSGDGFDPAAVPAPPALEAITMAASERGWGIQLITALVDDVAFRTLETGTAVDLVVRLSPTA